MDPIRCIRSNGTSTFSRDATVRDAFTFSNTEKHLLRGIAMRKVLANGGDILENAAGSAATYDLSEPVDIIDWFISHNWSTPRKSKWLALLFYENLLFALYAAYVAAGLVLTLGLSGCLPLHTFGCYCFAVSKLTFHMCFLFGRHMKALILGTEFVFLDKTCIHQTDKTLQQQGINKLGAFICNSRGMVVILTETYFTKLWTVYEFATYLIACAKATQRPVIEVVPTSHVPSLFLLQLSVDISVYLSLVSLEEIFPVNKELSEVSWSFYAWWTLASAPLLILVTVVNRRIFKVRATTIKALKVFSVQNAKCFVESDRALVYGNIANFMDDAGLVAAGTSRTQLGRKVALKVFDDLVRKLGPDILTASLGRLSLCLKFSSSACLSAVTLTVDVVINRFSRGTRGANLLAIVVYYLFFAVCVCNFMIVVNSYLASKFIDAGPWTGKLLVLGAGIVTAAAGQVAVAICYKLLHQALNTSPWFWVLIAFYILAFVVVIAYFHRPVDLSDEFKAVFHRGLDVEVMRRRWQHTKAAMVFFGGATNQASRMAEDAVGKTLTIAAGEDQDTDGIPVVGGDESSDRGAQGSAASSQERAQPVQVSAKRSSTITEEEFDMPGVVPSHRS
eukprot:TRINITY_DN60606_c0_g1_i1.p1 TRINITY_DN60606_c0_g1~~TRINITY_DN60606_c0_g1_i1.p1  ORF type:complete len:619 (+),score=55.96 TRINITY_DN60606_c0_g1_i1:158-2014(+)